MENNIIFLLPLNDFLESIKVSLEENPNNMIYEISNVMEYVQIIGLLEKSFTISTDLKQTQGYLEKSKKFIQHDGAVNIFITKRNPPPHVKFKLEQSGLDDIILEENCNEAFQESFIEKINTFFEEEIKKEPAEEDIDMSAYSMDLDDEPEVVKKEPAEEDIDMSAYSMDLDDEPEVVKKEPAEEDIDMSAYSMDLDDEPEVVKKEPAEEDIDMSAYSMDMDDDDEFVSVKSKPTDDVDESAYSMDMDDDDEFITVKSRPSDNVDESAYSMDMDTEVSDGSRNIIILKPVNNFLLDIKKHLEKDKENTIHEINSVAEYVQIIGVLGRCVTLSSDMKKTREYMVEAADYICKPNSKNILISKKMPPPHLILKMKEKGLNDVLREKTCTKEYEEEFLEKINNFFLGIDEDAYSMDIDGEDGFDFQFKSKGSGNKFNANERLRVEKGMLTGEDSEYGRGSGKSNDSLDEFGGMGLRKEGDYSVDDEGDYDRKEGEEISLKGMMKDRSSEMFDESMYDMDLDEEEPDEADIEDEDDELKRGKLDLLDAEREEEEEDEADLEDEDDELKRGKLDLLDAEREEEEEDEADLEDEDDELKRGKLEQLDADREREEDEADLEDEDDELKRGKLEQLEADREREEDEADLEDEDDELKRDKLEQLKANREREEDEADIEDEDDELKRDKLEQLDVDREREEDEADLEDEDDELKREKLEQLEVERDEEEDEADLEDEDDELKRDKLEQLDVEREEEEDEADIEDEDEDQERKKIYQEDIEREREEDEADIEDEDDELEREQLHQLEVDREREEDEADIEDEDDELEREQLHHLEVDHEREEDEADIEDEDDELERDKFQQLEKSREKEEDEPDIPDEDDYEDNWNEQSIESDYVDNEETVAGEESDYEDNYNEMSVDEKDWGEQTLDYKEILRKHLEKNDLPEYTKEILEKNPEKIMDLIDPIDGYYEGKSFGIEFLVYISELLGNNKINEPVIFKFINFSLMKNFSSVASFFNKEGIDFKARAIFHQKNSYEIEDIERYVLGYSDEFIDAKIPFWKDETFSETINYFVYPYYIDNEYRGFAIAHFKDIKIDHEVAAQVEMYLMLARSLYYGETIV